MLFEDIVNFYDECCDAATFELVQPENAIQLLNHPDLPKRRGIYDRNMLEQQFRSHYPAIDYERKELTENQRRMFSAGRAMSMGLIAAYDELMSFCGKDALEAKASKRNAKEADEAFREEIKMRVASYIDAQPKGDGRKQAANKIVLDRIAEAAFEIFKWVDELNAKDLREGRFNLLSDAIREDLEFLRAAALTPVDVAVMPAAGRLKAAEPLTEVNIDWLRSHRVSVLHNEKPRLALPNHHRPARPPVSQPARPPVGYAAPQPAIQPARPHVNGNDHPAVNGELPAAGAIPAAPPIPAVDPSAPAPGNWRNNRPADELPGVLPPAHLRPRPLLPNGVAAGDIANDAMRQRQALRPVVRDQQRAPAHVPAGPLWPALRPVGVRVPVPEPVEPAGARPAAVPATTAAAAALHPVGVRGPIPEPVEPAGARPAAVPAATAAAAALHPVGVRVPVPEPVEPAGARPAAQQAGGLFMPYYAMSVDDALLQIALQESAAEVLPRMATRIADVVTAALNARRIPN